MDQKITFQNILDDIPWGKKQKNKFRIRVIEVITTTIAELEKNKPIQSSDLEKLAQHTINLNWLREKYYESDEHRKEVYTRLIRLLTEQVYEWENQ